MPKEIIKRWMPDRDTLKKHKYLSLLGDRLLDPNLWHLNRRSAAGSFAVGLFAAWIPVPLQSLLAAAGAVVCRVNLPISVALVWVSNPLTMPLMFYSSYKMGCLLLRQPVQPLEFEFTWLWLKSVFGTVATPVLLGTLVMAILSALCGYIFIRVIWEINAARKWQKRKQTTDK